LPPLGLASEVTVASYIVKRSEGFRIYRAPVYWPSGCLSREKFARGSSRHMRTLESQSQQKGAAFLGGRPAREVIRSSAYMKQISPQLQQKNASFLVGMEPQWQSKKATFSIGQKQETRKRSLRIRSTNGTREQAVGYTIRARNLAL